ncbi:MAG: hypothetical protein ACRDJL_10945 [Actinomycetota bacterium]
MEKPVLRDGTWWQHHDDHWYRWNPTSNQWELGAHPPPPPPPPAPTEIPARRVAAEHPARAYTGSGKPVEELDGGNTWSSVTLRTETDPSPGLDPVQVASTRGPQTKLAVLGFVALAIVVAFGAYTFLLKGSGAPSDEDLDAALVALTGYEYQEAPEQFQDMIDATIEEEPMLAEHVSGFDLRFVERADRFVGSVAVVGYQPGSFEDELDKSANASLMASFNRSGEAKLLGAKLKKVERGNATMYEVTVPGASMTMFLKEEKGMMFFVATSDARSGRKISKQLALANL